MKYTHKEKIIFTKKEVEILDKASVLLDEIYTNADTDGDIESLARNAMESIYDLLSNEYSDMDLGE